MGVKKTWYRKIVTVLVAIAVSLLIAGIYLLKSRPLYKATMDIAVDKFMLEEQYGHGYLDEYMHHISAAISMNDFLKDIAQQLHLWSAEGDVTKDPVTFLRERLRVQWGEQAIVRISIITENPYLSEQIVNRVGVAVLESSSEERFVLAQEVFQWLKERSRLHQLLGERKESLREYQQKNDLFLVDKQQDTYQRSLHDLVQEKQSLQEAVATVETALQSFEVCSLEREDELFLKQFSEISSDARVLYEEYLAIGQQLRNMQEIYTPGYPAYDKLLIQKEKIVHKARQLLKTQRSTKEEEREQLHNRLGEIDTKLADTRDAYNELLAHITQLDYMSAKVKDIEMLLVESKDALDRGEIPYVKIGVRRTTPFGYAVVEKVKFFKRTLLYALAGGICVGIMWICCVDRQKKLI